MLYMSFGDGYRSDLVQNLSTTFGKLLRIDPLGSNSRNGKNGIPAANPFERNSTPDTLGEIYAFGLRNAQRFTWDPRTGNLFLADIGQSMVEKVTLVTAGANPGWNKWQGHDQDTAAVGPGEERRTRQAAGVTGGPAVRPRSQRPDFRAQ